jgi:dTDP-4-amino-4,6-dideoxygalactose transaminase
MTLALLGGSPVRTRPFPQWPISADEEAAGLQDVLQSGVWGGYHPSVKEFESEFAKLHAVRHAISCANGTVALEVALRAAGIRAGDEVIVPPFTFVASASAILLCGAIPVFADIDPETLNLSPAAAEAAITPRTRAILVVHFGGRPADMDAFTAIARRHDLKVIEDCAHAHGARWRGTPVGGIGVAGTFSFQGFKLMTAGEGGIIVTNSDAVAELCWSYCNQGRRRDGGWFEHVRLGTNYRITGFQAAVLLAQLRRLLPQTDTRAHNVACFRSGLADVPAVTFAADDPRVDRHPYYLVTLRYRPERIGDLPRDRFIEALQAEGIPAKPAYPYPLYRNPLFRGRGRDYEQLSLAEAERVCRDGIWLSHNLFLGDRGDVDDILQAMRKIQQEAATLLASSGASTRS